MSPLHTELLRALSENAFAVHGYTVHPTGARITLLEGRDVLVQCMNEGWRVVEPPGGVYDSLDSLLLNTSPRAMRRVNERLAERLGALERANERAVGE